MKGQDLDSSQCGLLVIDVQEKLFPLVENPCEMLDKAIKLIKGCKIMHLPIVISEQYPQGLGPTIEVLRSLVGEEAQYFKKTTFSCLKDPLIEKAIDDLKRSQWILMGIEAHVCILQTARNLLHKGYEVIVVNDSISSRSIYDFSTAIAELRDLGARIASTETVLFDLVGNSLRPEFKEISQLIK